MYDVQREELDLIYSLYTILHACVRYFCLCTSFMCVLGDFLINESHSFSNTTLLRLMVLDNVLLVQIKESSCFAQLLEKIHVMNLELFVVRHVLVQVASRRGGGGDSTCGGARQHFEEGA